MTYDPKEAFGALKALCLATNSYGQARQKGETGESMLKLEKKMLVSRTNLRDLLDAVFETIPEAKRPDGQLAQLIAVAERINWSYKEVMLYQTLEKLSYVLMRDDSGGERSPLWAKLLDKTLKHYKQKSACKGNPPKLPPTEPEEDDFERIEPDVGEDWEVVEAGEISEITDEAYVKLHYGDLISANYPDYDFIHEEVF